MKKRRYFYLHYLKVLKYYNIYPTEVKIYKLAPNYPKCMKNLITEIKPKLSEIDSIMPDTNGKYQNELVL